MRGEADQDVEQLADSLTEEELNNLHAREIPLLRSALLWLLSIGIIHSLTAGEHVRLAFRAVWFVVAWKSPPTAPRYRLYLRLTCFVLLPIRCALGWSGNLPFERPYSSPILAITLLSAFLHSSMAEHLADVLFANGAVLWFADMPSMPNASALACSTSVVCTVLSTIAVYIKCAWLKSTGHAALEGAVDSKYAVPLLILAVASCTRANFLHVILEHLAHGLAHEHRDAVRCSLAGASIICSIGCCIQLMLRRGATVRQRASGKTSNPLSVCITTIQSVLDGATLLSVSEREALIQARQILRNADSPSVEMSSASSFPAGAGGYIRADEGQPMHTCALEDGPEVATPIEHIFGGTRAEEYAANVLLSLHDSGSDGTLLQESVHSSSEASTSLGGYHGPTCTPGATSRFDKFANLCIDNLCNISFDAMAAIEASNDEQNVEHTKLVWWNPEFTGLATGIGNGDFARGAFELERSVLRSCISGGMHHFALSSRTVELHSRSKRVWIDEHNSLIFWVMCAHCLDHTTIHA